MSAALAAAGCSGDDAPAEGPEASSTPSGRGIAPGVTRDGPAAATSTVAPAQAITLEIAFPGLAPIQRPVEMVQAPGEDTFLLASQDGLILALDAATPSAPGTVLDIQDHTRRDGNEEGLLGFALDPAYPGEPYAYIYYNPSEGERRTVLSRFEVAGGGAGITIDRSTELVLLTVPQPYANHNGGKVAFGPDGMLYLGLGDGGSAGDPHGNGQSLSGELLGSILRIDVRNATPESPYTIPPDNPFATGGDAEPETFAWGLRNPWRFSFDRETGGLWAGDVGQNAFEEVDIIVRGKNYGWAVMEGGECYDASTCDRDGLTLPVASYSHDLGCSVTGGFVYRGTRIAGLEGVYLYSDYCSGTIWGLDAAAAEAGDDVEPRVLLESGLQVPSFAEDSAGELYVLAFDGNVYRLAPAE